jgi:hypothetical protein
MLHAEIVSHRYLATPYTGVTHSQHNAASALVRHTGQVCPHRAVTNGDLFMMPKYFLFAIWPRLTLG